MKIGDLKHYRLIEKIGWGGMGVVYMAEDLSLSRRVAIKFLAPLLVQDQEIMHRFRSEARNQARLSHSNITMVYAFQETEEQAFLVLEYVDGETLEKRLQRLGRLSVGESLEIFGKVLSAIEYAHSKGIVHRDIKPSNIGLTAEGVVKVMDFGIALNIEESCRFTKTGHIMGSPHYMAPEQILGRQSDHRTDIYALGITLFEMLTGRLPFEGRSDYEIRVAQVNEAPPVLPASSYEDIPLALERVIHKALAKTLENRFQSAQEFRLALDAAIGQATDAPRLFKVLEDKGTRLFSEATPPQIRGGKAPSPVDTPSRRLVGASILPWISIALVIVIVIPLFYLAFQGAGRLSAPRSAAIPAPSSPPPSTVLPEPASRPNLAAPSGKTGEGAPADSAVQPGDPLRSGQMTNSSPAPKAAASTGPAADQANLIPENPKTEGGGEATGPPLTTTPVEPAAATPRTLKSPPSDAPNEAHWRQAIQTKLEQHGFAHIQVSTNPQKQIMVSGRVQNQMEKNRVMQLVGAAGYAGQIISHDLSIREKPPTAVKKKIRPSRPAGGLEERGPPPGQSALPPAFD
ncbi:MAG: hypothetical protein FJ135_03935 [Deltaproteobacteria bacterium]|nr:hypothetical protein [Deltaproteobacteria bacterium]